MAIGRGSAVDGVDGRVWKIKVLLGIVYNLGIAFWYMSDFAFNLIR